MPRFDIYKNPNPKGAHAFYLDIQSDLVTTATRWCIPLRIAKLSQPMVSRAQAPVPVHGVNCLMDTPNLLAVLNALLRSPVDRLGPAGLALAEASVEFMLRGVLSHEPTSLHCQMGPRRPGLLFKRRAGRAKLTHTRFSQISFRRKNGNENGLL